MRPPRPLRLPVRLAPIASILALLAANPALAVGWAPDAEAAWPAVRAPIRPPIPVPMRAPTRAIPADSIEIFVLERLAEGVYAALVVERPDAYAFANSLVVLGTDGVLVVDTQQSPRAARELIRRVRTLTDRPVRWVVNTHWHGDHVYGNQAYREAFPGVRFLAHPATVTGMRGPGAARRAEELASLPASIADRERWLTEGRLPDGRPLDDDLRDQVAYSLRLRRIYLGELAALRPVEPEGSVVDRTLVDVGGRLVELIPLGPAHTEGDLAVAVPDAGVWAVGDLLEEGAAPWIDGAASLAGWSRALGALAAEAPRVVLPSHGGVQWDDTLLRGERALFDALVGGAREAVDAGWSDEDAVRALQLGAHRAFMAGLGVDADAFERWRGEAVVAAVAEERARRAGAR